MSDSISPMSSLTQIAPIDPSRENLLSEAGGASVSTAGVNFQDVLLKTIEQVGNADERTQKMIEEGLVSGDLNQAEIFIAMKKTDLAYRTLIQIRNQAIDAFNELQQMRM